MATTYMDTDQRALVAAVRGGERVAAAARRLGIKPSTAYGWLRRARGRDAEMGREAPTFLQLRAPPVRSALTVRIGAAVVEVRPGFDAALLREVVEALAGDERLDEGAP